MQKPGLFGMNGFFVFLLTCLSVSARAQQAVGLILIDAEGKQPFTVRIGDQMYPSSAHGHLTLSHLKDSAYRLCLRFPKNNLAEQIFPVNVRKKDLGFILKGADSSWVLYNWQTKETIHPVYILDSSRILEMGVKRDDGFSKLMASVVNDTSVMYNTYRGQGFDLKDSTVIGHRIFAIGEKPATVNPSSSAKVESGGQNQKPSAAVNPPPPAGGKLPPAKDSLNPSTANRPPPANNIPNSAVAVIAGPAKKTDKDSLIEARRQQNHIKDSLQAARKAVIKDSLAMVRMAKASSDSLKAVRKAFLRDSLLKAKRFTKDSLAAVKVRNDSLKRVEKNLSAVKPQPATAVPPPVDAGGESRLVPNSQPSAAGDLPSSTTRSASLKPAIPPKKIREVSLKISRKIVFLDIGSDGHTDTVTLFVYFESKDSLLKKPPVAKTQVGKKVSVPDTALQNLSTVKTKTPDSVTANKPPVRNKPDTSAANKALAKAKGGKPGQPACPDQATDADLLFIRSAMLKANTDQEKIAVSSGAFALKCFTVAQIRQLASIFVSDKSRYRLMDAAHMHIADWEHFPELADMYTDKNFQRKFLAMAEKRS